MSSEWELVFGSDLQDAYVRQTPLSDFVPKTAAIYLWRRALRVPREALSSTRAFTQWLDNAMRTPIAEVHEHRLSHFAVVDRLTFRSPGLTAIKRQQFGPLFDSPKARRWLAQYLHDLAPFTPPLYCGETDNLADRTRAHLSGETGFGQRIQRQESGISWSDLDLTFYRLDRLQFRQETRASDLRKLLELVSTAFSVAGYVSRRG